MKKFMIFLLIFFSSTFFIESVSADTVLNEIKSLEELEIIDFDYSEEEIWSIAESKGIDTNVYDGFLLTFSLSFDIYQVNLFFFDKDNLTNDNFYLNFSSGQFHLHIYGNNVPFYTALRNVSQTSFSSSLSIFDSASFTNRNSYRLNVIASANTSNGTTELGLYYYTNARIYVQSSNTYLEPNVKNIVDLNGYEVEQAVIDECNSLGYKHYLIHYNPGHPKYVFSCSENPSHYIYWNGSSPHNLINYYIFDTITNTSSWASSGELIFQDGIYSEKVTGSRDTYMAGISPGFEIYYSNYDVLYMDRGDKSNQAGEVYYECSSDTCINIYNEPSYNLHGIYSIDDSYEKILDYKLSSEVIENYHNFNFKFEFLHSSGSFLEAPVVKKVSLYKVVDNEYILVDIDDYINYFYDTLISDDGIDSVLKGKISFSLDFTYLNDYVLRFEYDSLDNYDVYFYDDVSLTFLDIRSFYLKDYIAYTFPIGYKYAFVSSDKNFSGSLFSNTSNFLDTTNNYLSVRYYYYDSDDYGSKLLSKIYDTTVDYSFVNFSILHDKKQILLVSKHSIIDSTNEPLFYVHKDLIVKFVNFNSDGSSDIYEDDFIYITPDGENSDIDGPNLNDFISDFEKGEVEYTGQEEINSWLDYINNYLFDSADTIDYVSNIIQTFFNDMPVWLHTFFVIAWIFLHLKLTIVLGGWK